MERTQTISDQQCTFQQHYKHYEPLLWPWTWTEQTSLHPPTPRKTTTDCDFLQCTAIWSVIAKISAIQLVSSWILTSHQPHRVTSGQITHSIFCMIVVHKSLNHVCQIHYYNVRNQPSINWCTISHVFVPVYIPQALFTLVSASIIPHCRISNSGIIMETVILWYEPCDFDLDPKTPSWQTFSELMDLEHKNPVYFDFEKAFKTVIICIKSAVQKTVEKVVSFI